MKNSIFKTGIGVVAILLCSCLLMHTAYASNVVHTFKIEKNAIKDAPGMAGGDISLIKLFMVADVPVYLAVEKPAVIGYLIPVNDAKPDNTHYQLIRKKQLRLHVADDSLSI